MIFNIIIISLTSQLVIGANPNAYYEHEFVKWTALHAAAHGGHEQVSSVIVSETVT